MCMPRSFDTSHVVFMLQSRFPRLPMNDPVKNKVKENKRTYMFLNLHQTLVLIVSMWRCKTTIRKAISPTAYDLYFQGYMYLQVGCKRSRLKAIQCRKGKIYLV